ncbi:7164_t:CDS:2 [Paraglomus brasilianum]|uniref:7164_t:CDS:1 n=1 Tax=Paraglomus brasilianum TaxID=144538 RepID=A0A9N9BTQ2_9GLOM|nr:7164_t:CDS:2 [Paraglomus brasilianum]
MPKSESIKKENIRWMINCDKPTPLAFYRYIKPTHHNRATKKYRNTLNSALECNPKNKEIQKRLTKMRNKFDDGQYEQDWEIWIQEKRATRVHRSIQETNENVHKKFNLLVESQSVIVEVDGDQGEKHNKQQSQIDNGSDDIADINIVDILNNAVEYSKAAKEICVVHTKYHPNDEVIDLRSKSPFLMQLSMPLVTSYLSEIDKTTEALIPENIHDFLTMFFSQDLTGLEWQNKIDDLQAPNKNDKIMVGVIRTLQRTLPQFIKAFSLGTCNPLVNAATIEKSHLNAFVHPCLEAALWHIAQVHYKFGEIPSKNHIDRNCADGAGFMTSADKFQLVYVEGSRPVAKDDKDAKKIMKNLKNIFTSIVKEIINNRRHIPSRIAVFGGQSFRLQLHLYYLDYCGKYRLNEVDNANLPRDFSEMSDFVWYYECVLKWALLVCNVTHSFKEARTLKRPSRLSYAKSLHLVKDM